LSALSRFTIYSYPSGRALTWTYDSTARQQSVAGTLNSVQTTYGNVTSFWPSAAAHTMTVSPGVLNLTQTNLYDYRLRPTSLAQTGTPAATLSYSWYPNGNLYTETVSNPTVSSLTTTYSYDGVNRLLSAQEGSGGGGSQSFTYDPFGNRSLTASGSYNPYSVSTPTTQSFSNNQVSGWSYDSAGNLLAPAGMVATATAVYDAENRVALVYDSASTNQTQIPVQYYYDADGRRALKSICSEGTTCASSAAGAQLTSYVYDARGQLAAEYGPKAGPKTPEYLFTDHLDSTRTMVESATGTTHCYDYTAFGLELGAGQSGRASNGCYEQLTYPSLVLGSVPDKFTGKKRDAETGLDYFLARYYSAMEGRFLSPDWAARPEAVPYSDLHDPQSLNLYGYVRNNPLAHADKDGHCWPLCTVVGGALVGALTSGGAEAAKELLTTGKVDRSRVENAAASGALTGALMGAAGPEAGVLVKVAFAVGGSVAGGAFERATNGEKVGDAKAVAVDVASAGTSSTLERAAEKTFTTEALKSGISRVEDLIQEVGTRSLDSGEKPNVHVSTAPKKTCTQTESTCQ